MVIFFGTDTSPSSGDSSPTIIRKRVVFPDPFGPTRPTFSPGFSWNDASTKRICRPYCLLMREKEIISVAGKPSGVRKNQLPARDEHRRAADLHLGDLVAGRRNGDMNAARTSHLHA